MIGTFLLLLFTWVSLTHRHTHTQVQYTFQAILGSGSASIDLLSADCDFSGLHLCDNVTALDIGIDDAASTGMVRSKTLRVC